MDLHISRPLLVALLASGLALSASPPSQAQSGNSKHDQNAEAEAKAKKDAKDAKDAKDTKHTKDKADRKGGDHAQPDPRAAQQDARKNDQRQAQANKQDAKQVEKQVKADDKADRRDRRLSQQEQRKLIRQQQVRVTQYREYRSSQQDAARRAATLLDSQNRTAQSRYVSNYQIELLRQQQSWNNNFNYDNDPYFYSAPIYRYQRGGSYYNVNQYGANLLKQAVNAGYQEGIQAGRADRMDRWRADYRNSFAYQDASYGYNGYYLSRDDYSYYFRQGFQRGYEDGYNSRYQYGRNSSGSYSILATILTSILGLQSY